MEPPATIFSNLDTFKEEGKTQTLLNLIKPAKTRGYLTKEKFMRIALWKSPRPKRHYIKNTEAQIIATTKLALNTQDEKEKILALISLHGVGIPTASAILTLINPDKYGIIDIRVWQTLNYFELVHNNQHGTGLTINNWLEYLKIIRSLAKKYHTSTRVVEQTLFRYHKTKLQKGNLYE